MPRYTPLLFAVGLMMMVLMVPTLSVAAMPTADNDLGGNTVTYCSTDDPEIIPDDSNTGITSDIVIPDSAIIADVNVVLSITHTWVGDIRIRLNDGATQRTIVDRPGRTGSGFGCSGDDFDNTIADDDVLSLSFENSCASSTTPIPAYIAGGFYQPGDPASGTLLNVYNGTDTAGTWSLNVADLSENDTGTLNQWCLAFTTLDPPTPTPTITPTPVPPTATSTHTATPIPPTQTHTATPIPPTQTHTATPIPPTQTHTATPVPPTQTHTATPIPPTQTHTATPVPPTQTYTATPIPPTQTHTVTPIPPTRTPTGTVVPPTATATTPPVPTLPPTPTYTNTPIATPTATPTGLSQLYAPLTFINKVRECQTIENEDINPNNGPAEAVDSLPICLNETLIGKHNLANDREDVYRLMISEQMTVTINLDVPNINLNLELYNSNASTILKASNNGGTADETITYNAASGRYFIRVYRIDPNVSEQEYRLLVTTSQTRRIESLGYNGLTVPITSPNYVSPVIAPSMVQQPPLIPMVASATQ